MNIKKIATIIFLMYGCSVELLAFETVGIALAWTGLQIGARELVQSSLRRDSLVSSSVNNRSFIGPRGNFGVHALATGMCVATASRVGSFRSFSFSDVSGYIFAGACIMPLCGIIGGKIQASLHVPNSPKIYREGVDRGNRLGCWLTGVVVSAVIVSARK